MTVKIKDVTGGYIKEIEALKAERDALAAQVEVLNSKNFELTCYRVDVLRCLKTIAFEHNHSDVPLYQPMARQLMDSISANAELKEVRAEAGRAGFVAGFNWSDCIVNGESVPSASSAVNAADEYYNKIIAGSEL